MQNPQNLIWIDLEMTGLNPDTDVIIEMATIVTDSNLNTLAEGPVIAIHQSDEILAGMDEWNTRQHGGSGLTQRVRESRISMAEAEAQTIAFLEQWVPKGKSPICGNSICQDRRFLYRHMKALKATSTTATWTSRPSRNWPPAGRRTCATASRKAAPTWPWTIFASPSPSSSTTASTSSSSDPQAPACRRTGARCDSAPVLAPFWCPLQLSRLRAFLQGPPSCC